MNETAATIELIEKLAKAQTGSEQAHTQPQTPKFDFDLAVKELLAGKKISGKDGVLAPLVKQLVEAALEAEVESHIANDVLSGRPNRRNGYNTKTVKSASDGSFELCTPRDRQSSFVLANAAEFRLRLHEPQIVKKHRVAKRNSAGTRTNYYLRRDRRTNTLDVRSGHELRRHIRTYRGNLPYIRIYSYNQRYNRQDNHQGQRVAVKTTRKYLSIRLA